VHPCLDDDLAVDGHNLICYLQIGMSSPIYQLESFWLQ
jgi:hypothetical protein